MNRGAKTAEIEAKSDSSMVGTFFVKEKKPIAAAPMHKLAMTQSNPEPKTVPNRANNPQIPEESNSLTFV